MEREFTTAKIKYHPMFKRRMFDSLNPLPEENPRPLWARSIFMIHKISYLKQIQNSNEHLNEKFGSTKELQMMEFKKKKTNGLWSLEVSWLTS